MAGADLLGPAVGRPRVGGSCGPLGAAGCLEMFSLHRGGDRGSGAGGHTAGEGRAGLEPQLPWPGSPGLTACGQGGEGVGEQRGGRPSPAQARGERWPVRGTAGCRGPPSIPLAGALHHGPHPSWLGLALPQDAAPEARAATDTCCLLRFDPHSYPLGQTVVPPLTDEEAGVRV